MPKYFAVLDNTWFDKNVIFPFKFMDFCIFRKLYEEEFEYKNELRKWELDAYHSTGSHDYIIEFIKEYNASNYNKILQSTSGLISAFRLVKYNRMYFSKMVCFENKKVSVYGSLDEPRPTSFLGKNEEINIEDIKKIEKIFKNMQSISSMNQRALNALHFWDASSCSETLEKKVIELFISLESLFTTGNNEVTYKLSNRMAWFLEKDDSSKRLQLFNKIKTAYDIRSGVVHGKKFVKAEELLLVNEIHSLVRDILLKIFLDKEILIMFSDNSEKRLTLYFNRLVMGDVK